jgi:2-keto-4-pentenoate hydratase/2-oxohepta-3-ene-1,7-dioic acid hydratase in catechol pathway
MRFVTYQRLDGEQSTDRVGVLQDSMVHEVRATRLLELLGDDGTMLRSAGHAALEQSDGLELDAVRLLAPIPRPPSVRDFMIFESHVEGTLLNSNETPPKVWYRQPLFYFSNPAAIFATGDDIPMPPGTHSFDFELEVAAVVGREGSNLTVEEAAEHIAGYMILNDWSARDIQFREMLGKLGPAKGKDTAITLGPAFVTTDELAPFASGPSFALGMEVELNGSPFGADRLDHMGWSFAQLVAYASRGTRVMPGDVLGSGTCGNGCIAEVWGRRGNDAQRALQPGDVVTMRVEELGEISNRVVEGPALVDLGAPFVTPPG